MPCENQLIYLSLQSAQSLPVWLELSAMMITGLFVHWLVFAGSAYTTVGFGTNPLPIGWDLVMVVIALSGMIAFGWSISVLFGMTQAVNIASQKRKELKSD